MIGSWLIRSTGILLVSPLPSFWGIGIERRLTKFELSDWQMHESVAAIAATGVSPIVRIAANEGWMVKSMHSV